MKERSSAGVTRASDQHVHANQHETERHIIKTASARATLLLLLLTPTLRLRVAHEVRRGVTDVLHDLLDHLQAVGRQQRALGKTSS